MPKLTHTLARLLGSASALLGFLMLGLWSLGEWRIAAFGPDYVPMAPITASLFALLGTALTAQIMRPRSRAAGWFETGSAVVGFAVAATVSRQASHHFVVPWDTWFVPAGTRLGVFPVGQMSPLTAAAFLLTSLAFLTKGVSRSPAPAPAPATSADNLRRAAAEWTSTLSTIVALGIGTTVLVGYMTGAPLSYASQTVPMALLTALGFVLIDTSILLAGPAGPAIQRWLNAGLVAAPARADRTFARTLVTIVTLLGILITVAGLLYMRTEQSSARTSVRSLLDSVANLKAAQVNQWRAERLNEGRFLQRTPDVTADITRFLAQPHDPAARAAVLGWLQPIKSGDRYEAVLLFDAAGELRLAISDPAAANSSPPEQLRPAVSDSAVALGDLEPAQDGHGAHLDVRVPILPPTEPGAAAPAAARPIATIILRLNPHDYLFPLIRPWPVPSASAETLLVRRDDDDIVYLNELRHRSGGPLALRRSIQDSSLINAAALHGPLDYREGVDYRGVASIATARRITDSPWVLIAKIDRNEVFAPIRRTAWQSGISLLLLLTAIAIAAAFIWRREHTLTLQHSLMAEKDRAALAERLALVMRHANDIILILDDTGRIVEASERALTVYGYTAKELRALPPSGLRAMPTTTGQAAEDLAKLLTPGGTRFETVHRRKDGTVFPVEVSGRAVEIEGRRLLFGIYRDITERHAHEMQIGRLNRLYAVLSQVNLAIVHAVNREGLLNRLPIAPGPANSALLHTLDRDGLLRQVCRILVEFGGFRLAWAGWRDPATQEVRVAADYGDDSGYLQGIHVYADDRPEGQGPTGTAIRKECTDVCNDVTIEPRLAPWREAAARAGYRSFIGLPLRRHGTVEGALTIYATELSFSTQEEISLLENVATDVAFGLEALEREEQRQRILQELKTRETELIEVQRVAHLGNWWLDLKSGQVIWSEQLYLMLGLDPQLPAPPYPKHRKLFTAESWQKLDTALARLASAGVPYELELEMARDGVSRGWMWVRGEPVHDPDGAIIALHGVAQDITARKQTEAKLQEQLDELHLWYQATLGREERIMELKGEVNELLARAGQPARYGSTPDEKGAAGA